MFGDVFLLPISSVHQGNNSLPGKDYDTNYSFTYFKYTFLTVIMAGLDPVKGINNLGDLVPACAPSDMANVR